MNVKKHNAVSQGRVEIIESVARSLKYYAGNPDLIYMCKDIANDIQKKIPTFNREQFMESCGFKITHKETGEDGRIFYNFEDGSGVVGMHLDFKEVTSE